MNPHDIAAELRARAEKARVRGSRIAARTGRADYQEGKADALDEAASLVESSQSTAEREQVQAALDSAYDWLRVNGLWNRFALDGYGPASTEPAPAVREEGARADLAERLERGADALSQRAPALSLTALEQLLREAAEALRSPDSGDGACSDPTCSYRAERDDGGAFGREEVQHALLSAGDPQEAWSILTGKARADGLDCPDCGHPWADHDLADNRDDKGRTLTDTAPLIEVCTAGSGKEPGPDDHPLEAACGCIRTYWPDPPYGPAPPTLKGEDDGAGS